jgi:hypothetical protein
MVRSCQSASTLKEMLTEAAARLSAMPTTSAQDLSTQINGLQNALDGDRVSAEAEHDVVSLCVLAEIEARTVAHSE